MTMGSVENNDLIDGVPGSGNPNSEWPSPKKILILSENRLTHFTHLEPKKDPCPSLLVTYIWVNLVCSQPPPPYPRPRYLGLHRAWPGSGAALMYMYTGWC